MFEICGTHFARGVFELRLEKASSALVRPFLKLGPIGGRVVALTFFVVAGLLTWSRQPGFWLVSQGWVSDPLMVVRIQSLTTWPLMLVGGIFYLSAFLFRKERLELEFDRHNRQLRFHHRSLGARNPARDGVISFDSIVKMQAIGPAGNPRTPHGHLVLEVLDSPKPYNRFSFSFLTDEQFRIYPSNLAKIVGKDPVGDWLDPDLEFSQASASPSSAGLPST